MEEDITKNYTVTDSIDSIDVICSHMLTSATKRTKKVKFDTSKNEEYEDLTVSVSKLTCINLTENEIDAKIKASARKKYMEGNYNDQDNYFKALDEIRQQIKNEEKIAHHGFTDYLIMYDEILYSEPFPEANVWCPVLGEKYNVKVVVLKCGCHYSFDGFRFWLKTFRPRGLKQCKKCHEVFTYKTFLPLKNTP